MKRSLPPASAATELPASLGPMSSPARSTRTSTLVVVQPEVLHFAWVMMGTSLSRSAVCSTTVVTASSPWQVSAPPRVAAFIGADQRPPA